MVNAGATEKKSIQYAATLKLSDFNILKSLSNTVSPKYLVVPNHVASPSSDPVTALFQ
jgi:hypothetical protein